MDGGLIMVSVEGGEMVVKTMKISGGGGTYY